MSAEPKEISSEIIERARRIAARQQCSVADVFERALDKLDPDLQGGDSIIGLFADEPELADQIMEDVYRNREQGKMRTSDG